MSNGMMMHGRRQHRRGGSDPMNGPRGFPGETGWPAFQNSWGNTEGGRAPASFAIVDDVLVIQGSVTGGVSGTVVFTLPVGYRPDASYTEPGALTINDDLANVTVDTDGTVTITAIAGVAGAYTSGGTDVAVADGGTGASTASGARTNLGVAIGSNVQAYDAELAALAGLTSVADRLPYFTGSGTAALATFTAAGRALVDDADAAAQRTTLGAAATSHAHSGADITSGTVADARIDAAIARDSEVAAGYQPLDTDLTAIAALSPATGSLLYRSGSGWDDTANVLVDDAASQLTLGGDTSLARTSAGVMAFTGSIFSLLTGRFTTFAAAGGSILVNRQVSTDAQESFHIKGDGTMLWGAGGASVTDTELHRSAADTLKTNDGFWAAEGFVGKVKAGVPDDSDLAAGMQQSGAMILDTANSRIYFRVGTTWKYTGLT